MDTQRVILRVLLWRIDKEVHEQDSEQDSAERCRRCGQPATIRGFCTDCARLVAGELKKALAEPAAANRPIAEHRRGYGRAGGSSASKVEAGLLPPRTNPSRAGKIGNNPSGRPSSAYVGKYLYRGGFVCPVCDSRFESLKVSYSRLRPKERHTDFSVSYDDFEPEFYYITVCRFCGYAAPNFAFTELMPPEKKALAELAVTLYDHRDFSAERTALDALECSRRAESFAQNRRSPHGLCGTILLHRAWLLRRENNGIQEKEALADAVEHLRVAYESETRLPGAMTKQACAYLIGEISRRLGDLDGALRWYSEVIKDPATSTQPAILRLARQQWQEARSERQKQK